MNSSIPKASGFVLCAVATPLADNDATVGYSSNPLEIKHPDGHPGHAISGSKPGAID